MEKSVRIFRSHAEAAAADARELAALTPQERLDRALALIARYKKATGESGKGVARVVQLPPR